MACNCGKKKNNSGGGVKKVVKPTPSQNTPTSNPSSPRVTRRIIRRATR